MLFCTQASNVVPCVSLNLDEEESTYAHPGPPHPGSRKPGLSPQPQRAGLHNSHMPEEPCNHQETDSSGRDKPPPFLLEMSQGELQQGKPKVQKESK